MNRCILALSGDLGSGKSTVARLVAEKLDLNNYSTGGMQRAMAAEMGITSLELNRLAETDPTVDQRIDGSIVELAAREHRVLFDSRMAFYFVPDSFRIFLTVDPRLGAERILNAGRGRVEQFASLEDAISGVSARRESEDRRYAELYGVSPERLGNYDLVVDTSYVEPSLIADTIVRGVQAWEAAEPFPNLWLSPRTPLPTAEVPAAAGPDVTAGPGAPDVTAGPGAPADPGTAVDPGAATDLGLPGTAGAAVSPIEVIRVGRYYYIYGDHLPISMAIRARAALIPARLLALDEDATPAGIPAREFAAWHSTLERIRAWESAYDFRFSSIPVQPVS